MNFLKRIAAVFSGGASSEADGGVYVYIRIKHRGEIVRLRISKSNEISRDDSGDLFVRKFVMGQRSFEQVEALIYFDNQYRVINSNIAGGELVTEADYVAQRSSMTDH